MESEDPHTFLTRRGDSTDETAEWLAVRDDYNLHLNTSNYSPATARTYSSHASLFARWCKREGVALVLADRIAILRYVEMSFEERAESTARNRMLALRCFYRWAIDQGMRKDDPTEGLKATRVQKQAGRPFARHELRLLLDACLNQRDKALLLVFICTGARAGEVLAMQISDIDWECAAIRIPKGKGDRQRWVALGDAAIVALRRYIGERARPQPVWLTEEGTPMGAHRAYLNLQKIANRAGVEDASLNKFRITFANHFLQRVGDLGSLQVLMGHSEIKHTARYAGYTDAKIEQTARSAGDTDAERALEQQRQMFDSLISSGLVV